MFFPDFPTLRHRAGTSFIKLSISVKQCKLSVVDEVINQMFSHEKLIKDRFLIT